MYVTGIAWLILPPMLALIGLAIATRVLRGNRFCPSCDVPMDALPMGSTADQPHGTYEVLVCRECRNAATLAHGQRFRYAWCPACLQRSLETPCIRLPDDDGKTVVEVHEECQLCGFTSTRRFEGTAPPRGLVLPFPAMRKKSGTED